METKLLLLVIFVAISSVYSDSCEMSLECADNEGRSLCYEKTCRRDVPCNKDNDCFFYGASDVSMGQPHPKCFKNPKVNSPPGYGVCMLKEFAGLLKRMPGNDVMDSEHVRNVEREMENLSDIFKIIKKSGTV